MDDQIIDIAMAQALQTDVARTRPIAGWVVMRDPPDYPDKIIARLVTDRPTPCVLMAESLAELQAQLPSGWSERDASRPTCRRLWRVGFRHSQPGPPRGRVGEVRDVSQGNR